jgi:sporulation protein YlmC with PRC-barrel domain
MAEGTPYAIGAEARCIDGICGHLTQVVIDPIDERVTHLIVEPLHRKGLGRLVPVEWQDTGVEGIELRHTKDEFDQLPVAEATRFLPGSEAYLGYDSDDTLLWPYFGGNITPPVTVDTLPVGEVAIRRDEDVYATDGPIGKIEGLIVNNLNHHVTHVVLQEGHRFGHKDVTIPVGLIKAVDEEGIRLSATKKEIEALPAEDFHRHAGR